MFGNGVNAHFARSCLTLACLPSYYNDTMADVLSNDRVILVPLSLLDAKRFYHLYTHKNVLAELGGEVVLPGERPEDFTERIISSCNDIWSIRLPDKPSLIIGDCALHHYNQKEKTIEIGGTLLADYRGNNYMRDVFALVIPFARQQYSIKAVVAKTSSDNRNALRFAKKYGFRLSDEGTLILPL